MLKLGDIGAPVRNLQILLNSEGAALVVDGRFGTATLVAVMDAQRRFGLVVDGIAGPKTIATLRAGRKPARLLGDEHLQRAADDLGVAVAVVRAVNEVESRGTGFLEDERPVILFERHVMYRRLRERGMDADALAAQHADLVSTKRGGYIGGTAEHARLAAASRIHREAAIESCSWGLFQVMGYHWQRLGYTSAMVFEQFMSLSEAYHLQAFVRFVEADPALHQALRERRWATFARLYNGPAYRENLYDVRLARAYARYTAQRQEAAA